MPVMSPNPPIRFVVSKELRAAIDARCQELGVEMSAYIRELILADLQRPELRETLRGEGRQPTPKPAKKSRKKSG